MVELVYGVHEHEERLDEEGEGGGGVELGEERAREARHLGYEEY